MNILELSHGLALISSCTDRREAISEKELSSSRFNFLFSRKTLQSNLSWLHNAFSRSTTLIERLSKDRLSLISESELEMFLEDLPMRQRPVKSHFLHLGFLEKSKSLRTAHARDMIFWNFFFFKSVLLLVVTLVAGVIPVGVVVLVRGVKLLPLEAVSDEVGGVASLEAAPG
jgi:hypothetical protein